MQLQGEKIYLRPVQKEDLPFFVEWLADPEVHHFTQGRSYTMEEEIDWFNSVQADKDEAVFSIFLKTSNELIGNCALHFNQKRKDGYQGKTFIGLIIGKKLEWRKGYGTDTVRTLLHYLKAKHQEKGVYLTVFLDNIGAIKCYQKCGFKILERRKASERPAMEEYVMRVEL